MQYCYIQLKEKMGKVNIKGRELKYIVQYDCSEYGDYYWTQFYEETYTKTYKKFWLFGPTLTKEVPIVLFTLHLNVEDEYYTKSDIRTKISRKLELLDRKEQIKRGELI